jgi:hypothetical protein
VKKASTQRITVVVVMVLSSLMLLPIIRANGQTTTVKVQASNLTPNVGDTITVDVTISNVQNLYGIELGLVWNPTILKVSTARSFLGVESHPEGVLHQRVNVPEAGASQSQYHLTAFSEAPADAFSGSGKIATLTFQVLHSGQSPLSLTTTLADKPSSGDDTSESINHTDVSATINSPIPEFSTILAFVVFLILATGSLVFAKKRMRKSHQA